MAEMITSVDYAADSNVWLHDKLKGKFKVKWIFIKDIPNSQLKHINVVNNEDKPVTNSRDTQELFIEAGREMLKIFSNYRSQTSILDDFKYYEKRQVEMEKGEIVQTGSDVAFERWSDVASRLSQKYSNQSMNQLET
ncbi:16927_t:CDS:2 [Racocetra persica]|uniref:16927_t:CDS:1 n=1 Tax=Racocetra persica TaxID=160502 RepID=A0ACA9LEY9_9GLOM|nr:16927_t:CDS:2 [Racocetra persica]